MRQVWITRRGGPEVLRVRTIPEPEPVVQEPQETPAVDENADPVKSGLRVVGHLGRPGACPAGAARGAGSRRCGLLRRQGERSGPRRLCERLTDAVSHRRLLRRR